MLWENLRADEFPAAIERSGGLCVMVLGCLEKHGPHLPVGTDSLKGDRIARIACEMADVMLFPTTMWLGDVIGAHANNNPGGGNYGGSYGYIGINPHTLLTVLEELCDEIARNGFKKILLLSSHGGNRQLLSYFMKSQTYKKKSYATMWSRCYEFDKLTAEKVLEAAKLDPEISALLTDVDYEALNYHASLGPSGAHADFRETGLVYGTTPELIDPERFGLQNGISTGVADYLNELGVFHCTSWGYNHPNAFDGYSPIGCTENIGKAMVKIATDRLVNIFTVLKNDEKCVQFADGTFKLDEKKQNRLFN